jgi:2-dehydropantoate 2-reductase
MRYVIYGAGAVGTLIGARLALSGQDVNFLARPHLADDFHKFGLHLTGDTQPAVLHKPIVSTNLETAVSNQIPDAVLLTVKAFDVQNAGEDILKHLPSEVPVVCFANGINNEKTLGDILESKRVIPATITTAVQLFPEGVIRVERERGIGVASSHPLIPDIIMDLASSDMVIRRYKDPDRMKWSKALTNIVSNASSAIIGWNPTQIFQHPGLYRLEVEALREVVQVMKEMGTHPQNLPGVPLSLLGYGIFLPHRFMQRGLSRIVARGRGEKRPSFHFDIGRGRSEVKWLNGAIAHTGAAFDVPTPANQILFETMMSLVDRSVEHEKFLGKPNELLVLAARAGVPGIQGYNPSRE